MSQVFHISFYIHGSQTLFFGKGCVLAVPLLGIMLALGTWFVFGSFFSIIAAKGWVVKMLARAMKGIELGTRSLAK